MINVDINCDLGEREDDDGILLENSILPWITSANVACGAHAGNPERMRELAAECRIRNLPFGAHPGYPDREGFGRHAMQLSLSQLHQSVRDQLELAARIALSEGVTLSHVKPHGALYNLAALDQDVAGTIASAVQSVSPNACLFALSGSRLIAAGIAAGLATRNEVFADRNYQADGTLVPRDRANALLHSVEVICERAVRMVQTQRICSIDGPEISVVPETICVHSDTEGAVEISRALYHRMVTEGFLRKEPPATHSGR